MLVVVVAVLVVVVAVLVVVVVALVIVVPTTTTPTTRMKGFVDLGRQKKLDNFSLAILALFEEWRAH